MTGDEGTLVEALAAVLADTARRAALDMVDTATMPDTPLRQAMQRVAEQQYATPSIERAHGVLATLAVRFGLDLDPDATPDTGERPVRHRNHAPGTASDLLMRFAAEHDAEPWTIEDALDGVTALGWTSSASQPLDTLRPLIARMCRDGHITRLARGRYATGSDREEITA